MDNTIEQLVEDFLERFKDRTITEEERKKFENISYERIAKKLENIKTGEHISIERINPEDGTIIYSDSYGRSTINVDQLGYQLVNHDYTERYVPDQINTRFLE